MAKNLVPNNIPNFVKSDPQITVNAKTRLSLLRGPAEVLYKQEQASSSTNLSSITWSNIIPPAQLQSIVNTDIVLAMPLQIVFAGTVTDAMNLYRPGIGMYGLRANWLDAITTSMSFTINSVTINLSQQFQYIQPLSKISWSQKGAWLYYDQPDQSFSPDALYGAIRSPINPYQSTIPGQSSSRSYDLDNLFTVVSNTTTAATITGTLYYNLRLPFLHAMEQSGIPYVSNMGLVINTASQSMMMEIANASTAATVTGVTVSLTSTPFLEMRYCNLHPVDYGYLPPEITLPSASIQTITTPIGVVANGGVGQQTSNSLQLKSIPSLILVTVSPVYSTQTFASADFQCLITQVSAQFGARSGLLAGADAYTLFQRSKQQGLAASWAEWNNGSSVLVIIPSFEFCLPTDQSNGSLGSFNSSFQVNYKNNSGASQTLELRTIYIFDAALTQSFTGANYYNELLVSPPQVLDTFKMAREQGRVTSARGGPGDDAFEYGAGFWDDFKKGFNSVFTPLLSLAKPVVSALLPEASPLLNLLPSGLGPVGGAAVGGREMMPGEMKAHDRFRRY